MSLPTSISLVGTLIAMPSGPTYAVTAPASINEGSTGTMNVTTTNVANGTTLYWSVELADDFGTSSGSFSISSNAGSFTVTPTVDATTEGSEIGIIRIRTGSTSGTIVASDTFAINDTSTTPPTYSVTAPASINEGSTGTMNVTTTNVANGTTLYWTVEPAGDFGTSSGSFSISSNAGSFTVTPTADATTEGSETGTIRIRTGSVSGTIVASDTFTINDTSTTPAAAITAVSPSASSVDEGSTITITIDTENYPDGNKVFNWAVVPGGSVSSGDFTGNTLSGTVIINSSGGIGTGSFTLTPTADTTTEGSETFAIVVTDPITTSINSTSTTITINDTSIGAATYAVTAPASINEGSAGTINVATTNVDNGTELYWTVTPSGDFGASSGIFFISSNAGSFTITPTADLTTEGSETGTIQIRIGSTLGSIVASDTFTINDTSTTPVPTYAVTAPASINEGSAGTMNVTTTNVSNGTTLYWSVEPAGDFGTSSGSFSISSNAGSFTVTPTADLTTEGSETGTIRIRTGSTSGTIVASDTFTINDTSTTPVPTYAVTAPASINEGSAGTMNVTTTNVANGTTLYWTVTPSGDFGTASGNFSISSNAGSFTVTPTADSTTEGAETGTIQIRTGSISGTIVASDTFTINDTSTTPVPTYAVTAPASIDEGSAGTMNVTTTNVSNGTTLYWTVTPSGDFGTSSGSFSISSNAGSFTVTPTADSTTEGSETGTIQIRTGSTGGTIVASDTFTINDTSLGAIPTGIATGRIAVDDTSFVADAQSEEALPDTESASAFASLEFDFSRQNISGSSGFRITIRDVNSDTANWYNTSDVSATLTSTPVTIYENTNAVPTEIKMDWSIVVDNAIGTGTIEKSAGTAVDDTWSSVGSDGSFIDATFTAEATAGPGDSSERTGTITVNFWGRASGYTDTLLATFSIDLQANADSVDGLSPLSANNA